MSIEVMTCVWKHAPVQSGELLILLALADFADDDGGCWPAVETLADRARMTPRNVQRCLRGLAERGLISIVEKAGPKGVNRYVVRPDAIRAQSKARGGTEGAWGDNLSGVTSGAEGVTPASQGGDASVTQTVTEPPLEPSEEREARARDQSPDGDNPEASEPDDDGKPDAADTPGRAAFEKRVMRFCTGRGFAAGPWPDWDTSSPGYVAQQFAVLAPDERAAAEKWRDPYLLDTNDRGVKPIPVGNFMRDKLWTGLDPAVLERAEKRLAAQLPAAERAKPEGWAACLGPVGMAWLFARLLAGPADEAAARDLAASPVSPPVKLRAAWPAIADFQALVRKKGGLPFGERWHALKAAMEPVPAGTGTLSGWREAFAARQWPWLPEFDRGEVVYCPKGGPDGLTAFEAQLEAHVEPEGRSASPPATGKTGSEAAE